VAVIAQTYEIEAGASPDAQLGAIDTPRDGTSSDLLVD